MVRNKLLLFISILGLIIEVLFGTLPLWPGLESFHDGYTDQNKQFYYTFIVLGIFACLLAIVGALMDHKFILIGTIWLSSFTAASYIIKLSWELIAVLIQYIKAFTEDEFSLKHWPVLAKYGMSIIFYCILTFAAYRSCDQILASFTQVHGIDENVTREEIDRIYMKISNSIGSKTLDNRLVQHRNELHSLLYTASQSNSSKSNTGQSTTADTAQNWATSSSFKMNSFAQPTNKRESNQLLSPNHLEMRPINSQSFNHGQQASLNPPNSPINGGPNNPNSMNLQSHRPSIQMHSMNNQPRASPRSIQ